MTPRDEKQIIAFSRTFPDSVRIELIPGKEGRKEPFEAFCDKLSQLAPNVRVDRKNDEEGMGPAIDVGTQIRYCAIPEDKELDPFLALLPAINGAPVNLTESIRAEIAAIPYPAELKIYIAPQCPFCPVAVKDMTPVAMAGKKIRLTIIDSVMFPETAQVDDIRSVPTVMLENRFRWSGKIDLHEILRMAVNRDPLDLSGASLKNMLENGDADGVAQIMLKGGQINPAFFDLLTDEKWPVRLGAMVAMETISEQNSLLASRVIEPLWQRFDGLPDAVKGDVLLVFSETGHENAIEKLSAVIAGNYAGDIKAAASESLETIQMRLGRR
jgi:hypothetical protein